MSGRIGIGIRVKMWEVWTTKTERVGALVRRG